MKEKRRAREKPDAIGVGDAYCFIGIERGTKLVLAWHLGRRTAEDAPRVRFQVGRRHARPLPNHDRWIQAVSDCDSIRHERGRLRYLVKQYATLEDSHRYSPGEVTGTEKTPCCGNPDPDRICTSHVERQNLTVRMQNRRMTRLTNAFSKKWENHSAMLALGFAYYNYCRPHQTLTEDRK